MANNTQTRDLMTRNELAELFGVSLRSVARWLDDEGLFTKIQPGPDKTGKVYVPRAEVEAVLNAGIEGRPYRFELNGEGKIIAVPRNDADASMSANCE